MIAQISAPHQSITPTDRATIAQILTWDAHKPFSPEEIVTLRLDGDWVNILLIEGRSYPIHRTTFRQILKDQKVAAPSPQPVPKRRAQSVELLARSGWIQDNNNTVYRQTAWLVTGETGNEYLVQHDSRVGGQCPCEGYKHRKNCYHLQEVEREIKEMDEFTAMDWNHNQKVKRGY